MIKIIIIALFAVALVLFAMRFFPALRSQIQRLLQNPFVRAILFRGLWRLIRLLIFRRQSELCSGGLLRSWSRLILAADLILIIHFCIVFFVVIGLVALPIGHLRNYSWTRNTKFRSAHMSLMGFVTIEAILGITCPLTILENILRQIEYQQSFVSYWLSHFIYWDLPNYFFVTLYLACFIWSLIFWKVHPPNYFNRKRVIGD